MGCGESFEPAQKKRICRKFEGKYIGFYNDIFKIKSYKKHPIDYPKLTLKEKKNLQVTRVDAEEFSAFSEAKKSSSVKNSKQACKAYEGSYLSSDGTEFYRVSSCKLRRFPDHESFVRYRRKRGHIKREIYMLSQDQLDSIRPGPDFPSVLDREFADFLPTEKDVEIISESEACKGLKGKVVSYLAKIYEINSKCEKVQIDASSYTRLKKKRPIFKELSSEEYASLQEK